MLSVRTVLVLAGAAALAGLAALRELGGILTGMHVPGAGSYGFGGPAQLTRMPWGAAEDSSKDVLRTWQDHYSEVVGLGVASPEEVVGWFALVDSVVVAPSFLVLLVLAAWRVRGEINDVAGDASAVEEIARRRLARRSAPSDGQLVAERAAVKGLLDFHSRLALLAIIPAALYFIADEVENVTTFALVEAGAGSSHFTWLFWTLSLSAKGKYLFFLLALAGIAAAALSLSTYRAGALRRFLATATVVRLQIAVALLFAAFVLGADQIADAIRRWVDDGEADGYAALIAVLLLSVVLLATSRRLLVALDFDRIEAAAWWTWGLLGGVLTVVGAICDVWFDVGEGLWAIGVLIALIGVLSVFALPPDPRRRELGASGVWLPAAIAAVPPAALGLAAMRAGIADSIYGRNEGFVALVLGGPALVVAAVAIALILLRFPSPLPRLELAVIAAAFTLGAGLAASVVANPWRTGELLGSVGMFAAFLAFALVIGSALVWYAERVRPLSFFTALRLRRTPVLTLLVLAAFLAASVDRDGAYYDARLVDPTADAQKLLQEPSDAASITHASLFASWSEQVDEERKAVPIVFVAAAGGGIRAAYWVATVLNCVVEGGSGCEGLEAPERSERRQALLALSGISGGSLGLASFVGRPESEQAPDWVDERLDDDYLAPVIAWTLFVDLPTAFIRRDGGTDRAEVLERAWERSWAADLPDQKPWSWDEGDTEDTTLGQRLFDRYAAPSTRLPLLLLNGTKVQDGCRLNLSALRAAPEYVRAEDTPPPRFPRLAEDCLALRLFEQPSEAERAGGRAVYVDPKDRVDWALGSTEDLTNFVCKEGGRHDLRLSTAVLLSARFPYVSPSGRLRGCRSPKMPAINVVDGGYFDTSGASPLVELWQELAPLVHAWNSRRQGLAGASRPCLVPVFLQIDTGYADPVGPGTDRPLETQVPLQTLGTARNAREANARQAAALAFSGPFGGFSASAPGDEPFDRYAHVYPRAHPGATAPLGWTLSETAQNDLREQLGTNAEELDKIARWFDDELSCAAA